MELYDACIKRKFKVENYIEAWSNVPENLMGDYEPNDNDKALVRERIELRLKSYNDKQNDKQKNKNKNIL